MEKAFTEIVLDGDMKPIEIRQDVHREMLYWSIRLVLGAMAGHGPKCATTDWKLGALNGEAQPSEYQGIYDVLYTYLTTDTPVGYRDAEKFNTFMRQHAEHILGMPYPELDLPEELETAIAALFLGAESEWVVENPLLAAWDADIPMFFIDNDRISLWEIHGPSLFQLLAGWNNFWRVVCGPVDLGAADYELRIQYGHNFDYPVLCPGLGGYHARGLYLFPEHGELVARALGNYFGCSLVATMVIPKEHYAAQFEITRVVGDSYRIDRCTAVQQNPLPAWAIDSLHPRTHQAYLENQKWMARFARR